MRKLKLELDALVVETFSVAGEGNERGTILGHAVKPSVTCETTVEGCETLECVGETDAFTCDWNCSEVCQSFDWMLYTCGC